MSDSQDDLLGIVKKQQIQIDELIRQHGELTKSIEKMSNNRPPRNDRRNNKRSDNAKDEKKDAAATGDRPKCGICGMRSHPTKKCWELEQNKGDRPPNWKSIFE